MAERSSTGLSRGRLRPAVISSVATGLLVFVACFVAWLIVADGAIRAEVRVMEAILLSPQRPHAAERLQLIVDSCNENPHLVLISETDVDVRVKAVAFSRPFAAYGNDCQDIIEVQLIRPLGDRAIIDLHTGQRVKVR